MRNTEPYELIEYELTQMTPDTGYHPHTMCNADGLYGHCCFLRLVWRMHDHTQCGGYHWVYGCFALHVGEQTVGIIYHRIVEHLINFLRMHQV